MAALVKGPALPQPSDQIQPWAGQFYAGLVVLLTSYSRAINSNAIPQNVAPSTLQPGRAGEIAFITTTLKPAYYDGTDWRYFDTNAVV